MVTGAHNFSASLLTALEGIGNQSSVSHQQDRLPRTAEGSGDLQDLAVVRTASHPISRRSISACRSPEKGFWLTSLGTSISTGPGRPVRAMWKASLTILGMSLLFLIK